MPRMLLLLLLGLPTGQALSFASVFGDDQVLQRSVKAAVYGTGTPGTAVTVSVTDDSTGLVELTAPPVGVNAQGEWKALLPPHAAGTGFTVTASTGKSGIVLHRISFGDVWFCSGQSNMELPVYYTFTRNQSLDAVAAGKYDNIRLLHFDHNPLPKPAYVTNGSIATNVEKSSWLTPAAAMAATKDGCHGPNCQSELDAFSATCFYYGESLTDRMVAEAEAAGSGSVEPVPIGLIESAFGGTCIESWLGEEEQLQCSNITCTSNQSWAYTRDTQAACAAIPSPGNSAGSNAELFNGMVSPFVNMTLKGYLWYQGENNLPYLAGNVLDKAGYACLLPALIAHWRAAWSVEPGTTDPVAPFGIVVLADSTDEGWGSNVPQMHWAETANHGVAPNADLPGTFLATAHDLPDPWADGCAQGASCCISTDVPLDPRCDRAGHDAGWLQPGGNGSEPTTHSMGVTIHPRVKRQVGKRLAQAAWSLVYGHEASVPWTGPVISGCDVRGATVVVKFNATLLTGGAVHVRDYNKTEKASVMWVLTTPLPSDADKNWLYTNRQPWWGDSSAWINVDIATDPSDKTAVVVTLPPSVHPSAVTAIKYGHQSPKGSPQSGEDKICCGDRDFATHPCRPESCPIGLGEAGEENYLPAMPFHAAVVGGKCKCFAPQVCDE